MSEEEHQTNQKASSNHHHSYLSDMIYGGVDGSISTLAIVSGVAGAGLSLRINIILGIASLIADGFSMATSNYISTRADCDKHQYFHDLEYEQINTNPEQRREAIRNIYQKKGFQDQLLESTVDAITRNPTTWVNTMLREEYGLADSIRSPYKAAFATFLAFIVCGSVPLLPFLLTHNAPFKWACGLTGLTFFTIGSIKSQWSIYSWWRSGLTTFAIGGLAAFLAYSIGYWVEHWARSMG